MIDLGRHVFTGPGCVVSQDEAGIYWAALGDCKPGAVGKLRRVRLSAKTDAAAVREAEARARVGMKQNTFLDGSPAGTMTPTDQPSLF